MYTLTIIVIIVINSQAIIDIEKFQYRPSLPCTNQGNTQVSNWQLMLTYFSLIIVTPTLVDSTKVLLDSSCSEFDWRNQLSNRAVGRCSRVGRLSVEEFIPIKRAHSARAKF